MADNMADIPESIQRRTDEYREIDRFAKAVEEESDPEARAILEESQAGMRALARRMAGHSARASVLIDAQKRREEEQEDG